MILFLNLSPPNPWGNLMQHNVYQIVFFEIAKTSPKLPHDSLHRLSLPMGSRFSSVPSAAVQATSMVRLWCVSDTWGERFFSFKVGLCFLVTSPNFRGIHVYMVYNIYGDFLKWWYPTTMGFPTKNEHFGVFWGYHHLRKHPYRYIYIYYTYIYHEKSTMSCTQMLNFVE